VGSGKWEVGSGKWEVGSGKWEVGSGKWEVGSTGEREEHAVPERIRGDDDSGGVCTRCGLYAQCVGQHILLDLQGAVLALVVRQ